MELKGKSQKRSTHTLERRMGGKAIELSVPLVGGLAVLCGKRRGAGWKGSAQARGEGIWRGLLPPVQ